jgi:transposase
MGKKRRQYTHEFKLDAVRLVVEQGRGVTDAARSLGIDRGLLQTWKKRLIAEGLVVVPEGATRTNEGEELHRLRKENARLRQERDILKKAAAYFASESS